MLRLHAKVSDDCYRALMPPCSCDILRGVSSFFFFFLSFSGDRASPLPSHLLSRARLRSRFELISVKLLISLISRHAAKRLDLTGQAWASTETTDLRA